MKILILGATGFIGSWITSELINSGHEITCCVRNKKMAKKLFPNTTLIHCNFFNDKSLELWKSRLKDIDVIINCVGIFYHPNKKIIWQIHYNVPKIIYDAAFEMNIKKIIHISALNVDIYPTEYAKSKKAIENYLKTLGINSIILRPSLVYGPTSSGGMSLFRALAAMPYFIPLVGKGNQRIQPIHVEDLARAIDTLLKIKIHNNLILFAAPSAKITLKSMLSTLRNWLGFPHGKFLRFPIILLKMINYIGDFIPYSTINSTAMSMLLKNNVASEESVLQFQKMVGFTPKDFKTGVYLTPSSTQDRWHARLFLIKPLLRISLAFIWLISALTSAFWYPKTASNLLLAQVGVVNYYWQNILLFSACLINFLIGFSLLINYKTKINCLWQILIIVVYTLIITWKIPSLWLEPFGPIAKNIPLLIAITILYILQDKK